MARRDLDKDRIRRAFDRAAPTYDAHADVQKRLALGLAGRIDDPPASILELGCGTGMLTAHLRDRFPDARIVAVDFAPAMAERTRAAVPDAEVLVADVETLHPDDRFALTVSSATVQWFADPAATFGRLVPASDRVLVGTFGPRTFWELDAVFAELGEDRGMSLPSAADWVALLRGAGAADVASTTEEVVVHYPRAAGFLEALRGVGATGGAARQTTSTVTRALRAYDERFRDGEGVQVTYELVVVDATVPG
jgi:malonyl-CoA O-methyltransferase